MTGRPAGLVGPYAGRWSGRGWGRLVWLLLGVVAGLAGVTAPRAAAAPRLVVEWRGDRLSVRARAAPWDEVLAALECQTGVQMVARGPLTGALTQAFEALPLEQGLRRLFRRANVVWFYAPGTGPDAAGAWLVRVWVLPKEDTAPEERQVRARSSGLTTVEELATPDVGEPVGEGVPRTDVASPEEAGAVEEQDPAERLKRLDAFAREGDTEALQQGLLDPVEAVRVRALELLEQGEMEGK